MELEVNWFCSFLTNRKHCGSIEVIFAKKTKIQNEVCNFSLCNLAALWNPCRTL